jgi:hypothetical protein
MKHMPREITRDKPQLDDNEGGGLEEFKSTRVVKDAPASPGWTSDIRPRSSGGQKVPRFDIKLDSEEVIVKVLESGPGFYAFFQHWIVTTEGRRAYTCPGIDVCPLCARGDKFKSVDLFNVIELKLNDKDELTPELKVWFATADPAAALKEKATSKKGPLNRDNMYLSVAKHKGTNGFPSFTLEWVRADELTEDWGLRALSPAELTKFAGEAYDSTIVRQHTVSELTEVARKYLDVE